MFKEQGDKKAPNPAVAVEIGVDALELNVGQADPHELVQVTVLVQVLFEIAEQAG